ncbi:hypothetical protein J2125_003896 [Erwinia toletana]|uniref:Uncharacterized protein n=1 Tax=Winslowiella toletana TaxID=92490 RepID=A0ABS4PDJ0_9GAMM|nr:hypothetical protein [Winslowiella toletana]
MCENGVAKSVLPVVISPEVWEKTVRYPQQPDLEHQRLGKLLMTTLMYFCNVESGSYPVKYGIWCLPSDSNSKVAELVKLQLNYSMEFISVYLCS